MDRQCRAHFIDRTSGARIDAAKIASGKTPVLLSVVSDSPIPDTEQLAVKLRFDWHDSAAGSRGTLRIVFEAKRICDVPLNGYGPTFFSFDTRKIVPKYDMRLILIVDELSPSTDIGETNPGVCLGGVSVASAGTRDTFGPSQIEFVRYAISAAKALGLSGFYMTEEKTHWFQSRICGSLSNGEPLSIIRLGDGEGRVLGYPLYVDQSRLLFEVLYYHFGPESIRADIENSGDWIESYASHLGELLRHGIEIADIVGIPVSDFFDRQEPALMPGLVGYACATHYTLGRFPKMTPAEAVGTNVFQQLAANPDFFPTIAKAARSVTTVGPWDLTAELSAALGVPTVSHIAVPGHYTWRKDKGLGQFPDLYKKICATIRDLGDLRGQLFFVGAGVLGKYYCALIKQQGGVALDVGSVFDSWRGAGLPYAVENGEKIKLSLLDPSAGKPEEARAPA